MALLRQVSALLRQVSALLPFRSISMNVMRVEYVAYYISPFYILYLFACSLFHQAVLQDDVREAHHTSGHGVSGKSHADVTEGYF